MWSLIDPQVAFWRRWLENIAVKDGGELGLVRNLAVAPGKADIMGLAAAILHFLSREAESPTGNTDMYLRVVPDGDLKALLSPKGGKLRVVIDALPDEMAPAVVAAEMGYAKDHPNSGSYDPKQMYMPETT